MLLAVNKLVILKMLPFDNKSEFQVVLDMPEGTSLEQTARVLAEMGDYLSGVPEVTDYQVYAGTAAPINFNGLVRQYYLREGAHLGDIQVNLVDKHHRDDKSHAIAVRLREPLQAIARQYDGNAKIVEIPPGPPVLSPLVAEVYGIDYPGQIAIAKQVRGAFGDTADIVDIDDSVEYPSDKFLVVVDRAKAARLGVEQASVAQALDTVLDGEDMSFLHGGQCQIRRAHPRRIRGGRQGRPGAGAEPARALHGRATGAAVGDRLGHRDRARPQRLPQGPAAGGLRGRRHGRRDRQPAVRPVRDRRTADRRPGADPVVLSQPENPYEYSVKWDGEWQITYETFRDMGIAYGVGLILIYLLVVAQFRSYLVPLVIMAPIPLTIIGIMPGHALLGAQFTATSMIGMIALAGIIVRNSILLVDFINQQVREGSRSSRP